MPVGETIDLKVLSVDPRPILEIVGNLNAKGQEAELLPTIITISARDSEKAIETFINKIGQEIEAQVIKQHTQSGIEIQIDGKSFAAEVSKPLPQTSDLTLRISSLFPRIALEIVPRSPILKDESFLNMLFEYFDTKQIPAEGKNSPGKFFREVEQVLFSPSESATEANHQNKLSNARVWGAMIESIAESILSEKTLARKEKTEHEIIADGTIRSLAHSINGEIARDNKIFLPFPFPLENRNSTGEMVISKGKEKDGKKGDQSRQYSAFICLDTPLLGKLQVTLTLDNKNIHCKIKGNSERTIHHIKNDLVELRNMLHQRGFYVIELTAILERNMYPSKHAILQELVHPRETGMNIVA